jgi:hypothetical protein
MNQTPTIEQSPTNVGDSPRLLFEQRLGEQPFQTSYPSKQKTMSFCRFSDDDFRCDLYCIGTGQGATTYVANGRYPEDTPKVPDLMTSDPQVFADAFNAQMAHCLAHGTTPLDLPHAGETFVDPDMPSFLARVESLAALGYRIPAWLIPTIKAEIPCPKCNGVPVAPDEPACKGCLECDFTGTLAAFDEMQKALDEANHAQDEYIKDGVCAQCGARSMAEAAGICSQSQDATGEYSCAGENLWEEERQGIEDAADAVDEEAEWETEIPTQPGNWMMRCGENEQVPELVIISCDENGELWALDENVGRNPLAHYHGNLTNISWRKANP